MTIKRIQYTLASINFFLADVRDGLGPFLAVYFISMLKWDSNDIGLMMTTASVATLLLQVPAGALVDKSYHKRLILVGSSLAVALAMLCIQFFPYFYLVLVNKAILGGAAAFIPPAVAALTLGTVGRKRYPLQVATNEAFNHTGNIFACIMAAIFAETLGLHALFSFTAIMAFFVIISTLSLKQQWIDHDVARGLIDGEAHQKPTSLLILFENKNLLYFGCSILLFHLANAAMLLLLGEEVAVTNSGKDSIVFLSGSIISAQAVMFLMALLTRLKVNVWGRKPLFLLAFIVLPIRGILFTFSANPYYLLAVQLLDGVGAGLFGALFPIVIADFTKGTGHYNIALGALSMMQGIGAAASTLISGFIVTAFGFKPAFFVLTSFAVLALILFLIKVPESKDYPIDKVINNV